MTNARPTEFNWMSQLNPDHKRMLNQLVRAGCHVRAAILKDQSVRVSVSFGGSLIVERCEALLSDAFGAACGEAKLVLFGKSPERSS